MAKKEQFDLDNYDFGSEFDVPEFDFDLEPPKDDRKPATKFAAGVAGGIKDQLTSPDTVRRVITKALPKGYGSAINLADQAVGTYKSLYDSTAREMKPLVNDLKRSTQKILPAIEKAMPKSFAERARNWAQTAEDKRASFESSEADRREAEISATVGATLGQIADQEQQDRAEDKAKDSIRDGINQSRHKESMGVAGDSALSLTRLTAFNDKMNAPYMRKSLEIQLRQYYLAMDAYAEQKKQNAIVEKGVLEITKNTGLPDYVKLQNTEYLAQVMRNKFLDGLGETLFSKRKNFIRGLGQRVVKAGQQKVKDFAGGVRDAMGAADSLAELQEMNREFGGPSGAELGGNIAGGAVADKIADRIGKYLGGLARKNASIEKGGNKAQYFVENLPQIAGTWANGQKGDDLPIVGGLLRFLKDQVSSELRGPSQAVESDDITALQQPGVFSRHSNKALTEIIPGYLARILREVTSIRTGDLAEMVEYDFTKNKFDNASTVKKNIFKQVIDERNVKNVQDESEEAIKAIDKDNKLNDQQRRTLARQLAKDNLSNMEADPTRYMDSSAFTKASSTDGELFAELFKEFFKEDANEQKKLAFARDFRRMGESMGDHRESAQSNINAGNLNHLIDLGIVKKDGSAIDMERLFDIYLPKLAGTPADPNTPGSPQPTPIVPVPPRRISRRRGGGSPPSPNPQPPTPSRGRGRPRPPQPPVVPPTPTAGNDISLPPTPLPPPVPVVPRQDIDTGLREAISEASSKSEAERANEILARIEKRLEEGITLYGSFGDRTGGPAGGRPFGSKTLSELGSDLWGLGGKAARFTKDQFLRGGRAAKATSLWGMDKAKQGWGWLTKKADEINDVYIKGELVPRLLKVKLEAGQYFDQATGAVIKSYKDIKGNVVDENGNIVIDAAKGEIKKLYMNLPGGQKLLSAITGAFNKGKDLLFGAARRLPGIYGMAFDLAKKGYDALLDGPEDIYVVGKPDPVMLAVTMAAGGYASRATSKVIRKPSDIDGPVYDHEGKIVLTAEDLARGLLDRHGRPLKTGWRKGLQWAKDKAMWGFDKLKQAGTWMKDKVTQGVGWLGDKLGGKWGDGKGFGISIGRSTRTQARLLLDIRDMLNDRLPGERNTFEALPDPGPDIKERASAAKKKLAEVAKNAKERVKAKVEGKFGPMSGWKDGIKEWWADGKDRRDNLRRAAGEKKQTAQEKAKSFFDTKHSQMAALFDKYFGKKNVAGDADGDGVRDGSYQDQIKKLKEKAAAAKEKAKELGSGAKDKAQSIYGKAAGGAKSLWDRLRGKKDGEEGDGDVNVDLGGDGGDGRTSRDERRRRRLNRRAPKGFWNKTKHYGGKVGRGLWGVTKGAASLGMGLLGLGGTGSMLATAGGAALTAGGWLLGGMGAIGGAALSLLASPVVLGGLALAAVGAGAYYGYKALTSKKLDKFNTPRYAQYGFQATDETHLEAVMGLEDLVEPAVSITEGKATLDTKKVDFDKAAESFGVKKEDPDAVTNFIRWFAMRFKPVFLTHLQVARSLGAKTLSGIADLKPNQIKQYITGVRMADGPYSEYTSPFPDLKSLVVGATEVGAAWDALQAEIDKMPGAKDPVDPKLAGLAATSAAAMAAATKASDPTGGQGTGNAAIDNLTAATGAASALDNKALTDLKALSDTAASKLGVSDGGAAITLSADETLAQAFDTSRIDALAAIRYKTYGLNEMAVDKLRSIVALENYIMPQLTFKGGAAKWAGSPEKALAVNGPNFGVEPGGGKDAIDWALWFRSRFMPVFLNYATAVNTAAGRFDLRAADLLKPMDKIQVATAVYTSKSTFNDNSVSVWGVPSSPWPGYTLNGDSKSIEPNMTGLREQSKKAVIPEETSKAKTSDSNAEASAWDTFKKGGIWGSLKAAGERVSEVASKYVPDFVKNAYSGAKEAMGFGGGREIDQPGKGSGGDINAIPKPTGNGSWAALKDTIIAAARMVGVDEKLMASMAAIESSFDYTAKAPTSSASGLFQFLNGTWKDMLKKFGPKYGIDPSTTQMDPRANALLGGEFLKGNMESLKGLGRPLTDTDLYLAHFLGAGDAKKLLSADPNGSAAQLLPKPASANQSVFFKDGRPLSNGEVYQWAQNAVKTKAAKFGVGSMGSETTVASSPSKPKSADAGPTNQTVTGTTMPGTTPGQASADKPAETAPAQPEKTSNPIGNFPVADQGAIPKPVEESPMQTVTVVGKRPAKNVDSTGQQPAAADDSLMGISPRALDINSQQKYQRDQLAESLKDLPGTAKEHLGVSKDMLGVLKEMRDSLKTLNKGVMQAPVKPVSAPAAPVVPAPVNRPQAATQVPVSMSKATAMNQVRWA